MATLWKRAIPSQYRMLKAIAGAVINTLDAHSRIRDKAFARSVAKRAVGTLTADWPEVLAAKNQRRQNGLCARLTTHKPRGSHVRAELSKGDRLTPQRRSPLRLAWKAVAYRMWKVKRGGSTAEYEMHVRVLRLLDLAQREFDNFYKEEK
jgi:hypothetical protein